MSPYNYNAPSNFWAIWLSIVVYAMYFVTFFLFGRDPSKYIADALVVGTAVTLSIQYGAGALPAIRDGAANAGDKAIISIWAVWLGLFGYFVYVVLVMVTGRPEWLRLSPIGGFFSTTFWLAGMYAVFAPMTTETKIPRPALAFTIAASVVGAFVSGVLITLFIVAGFGLG